MRIVLFALLLAACGPAARDPASGVTAGEAQALNDAAAMLDGDTVDANAVDNAAAMTGNGS